MAQFITAASTLALCDSDLVNLLVAKYPCAKNAHTRCTYSIKLETRLPLHSLLSAVSFQGHKGIYVAVAVTPKSSTGTQTLSSVGGGVSGDNNLHDASRYD